MNEAIYLIIFGLTGYLFGSIPFGYLISLRMGVDIRTKGSSNIGALNVYRTVGKKVSLAVFLLDSLKSFIPVVLIMAFWQEQSAYTFSSVSVGAVVGHCWPVWLKFKGGKGVATSIGVIFGGSFFFPWFFWLTLATVLFVLFLSFATRYVSLAVILGFTLLSIALVVTKLFGSDIFGGVDYLIAVVTVTVFILFRHRSNIGRLLSGNERKLKIKN